MVKRSTGNSKFWILKIIKNQFEVLKIINGNVVFNSMAGFQVIALGLITGTTRSSKHVRAVSWVTVRIWILQTTLLVIFNAEVVVQWGYLFFLIMNGGFISAYMY